jgi:hypothetical protein
MMERRKWHPGASFPFFRLREDATFNYGEGTSNPIGRQACRAQPVEPRPFDRSPPIEPSMGKESHDRIG